MVANAGIASYGSVLQVDPEAFKRLLDINVLGVFHTVRAALPSIIDRRGYVLIVSSLAAFAAAPGLAPYNASKAAVEQFANALRLEVAHRGVDVGSAHMSWIDTAMVRDTKTDLSTFAEMLSKLPGPLNTTTSVEKCGDAFVKGIEGRKTPGVLPRLGGCAALAQAACCRPASARRPSCRFVPDLLPRMDAEVAALGRSTSAHSEALGTDVTARRSPRSPRHRQCRRRPRCRRMRPTPIGFDGGRWDHGRADSTYRRRASTGSGTWARRWRDILTDPELIRELEPVVEAGLNQHFAATKDWSPHDYVPWSDGADYAALGGPDWELEQSPLSELARIAMVTNLLTEDNLPSYHRAVAGYFTLDDAWGTWVNRWTVEENRHGIALRDYLVVTRAVDPMELEQARMQQVTAGFSPGQQGQGDIAPESFLDAAAYVTFQELATRVSHRNTGKACEEPVADALLKRDRVRREPAHDLLPRADRRGARSGARPGHALDLPHPGQLRDAGLLDPELPPQRREDGRRRHLRRASAPRRGRAAGAAQVADLRARRLHRPTASANRDELAAFIEKLEVEAAKFEESKARYLERATRARPTAIAAKALRP